MTRTGSRRRPLLVGLAALAALALVGGAVAVGVFYWLFLRDLPELQSLDDYHPPLTTVVLDRRGRPIGEFYEERRRRVAYEDIPEHVVLAFVAGEDNAFFEHEGIDYRSILRAAWVDLTSGEIKQGASTITQQTVKSLLLTPERRFSRKIKELVLARRLEERFTKPEILTLYLNQIYFGSGAWGIAEAARTYFGKDVRDVTVGEAALLAGLPKAPSRYSPVVDPEAAEGRRQYVLRRMLEEGYIDEATYEEAAANPPTITGPPEERDYRVASWFTEEVRRRLFDELGGERVLRGGLTVETTLDLDVQREAVAALRRGLEALERRQGWRGPLRHVPPDQLEAEIARVAEENGLAQRADDAHAPPAFEPDRTLVGVVVQVEPRAKRVRVAFAPRLEGTIPLAELEWARKRRGERRPGRPLERVLARGDVATFRVSGTQPATDAPLVVTLFQEPEVQGAVLSLEVPTDEVIALVGGYDFERSEFNRAVQALRQPGSAFKPIIYAAALSRGYTPVTIIHDRPVVYSDPETGFTWRPENYGRRFLGPLPLREALARSVNNATIHLLRDVGVRRVARYAQALGIRSPLETDLSLALGASPVSLLELTRAYAVFAAGGRRVVPRYVRRVTDPDGNVLLANLPLDPRDAAPANAPLDGEPAPGGDGRVPAVAASGVAFGNTTQTPDEPAPEGLPEQVIPRSQAFLATSLLRAVVEDPRGTGRRARVLGRPVAGKTGTTNEQGDAWFVGFSPDVVTGVWVGYDERRVLGPGETGGRAALPIWIDVMRAAHRDRAVRDFPVPPGIVFARVDRTTGLLADGSDEDAIFQPFLAGTEPTEQASRSLPESDSRRMMRMDF